MKQTTCAVVLIDKNGSILGCHSYGQKENQGYDFPKGIKEENETDLEAAVRELYEETNIKLSQDDIEDLIDLGLHKHNKEKNIHIFLLKVDFQLVLFLENLKCNSYFERRGEKYPEVDGYKIISKEERYMFNNVLQDKFELIDQNNV